MPIGVLIFVILGLCTIGSFLIIPSIHMRVMHVLYRRVTGRAAPDNLVRKTVFYSLIAFPAFFFTVRGFGLLPTTADDPHMDFKTNLIMFFVPILLGMYVVMSFTWFRVFNNVPQTVWEELRFTVPGALVALVPLFVSLTGIVLLIHFAYGPGAVEAFFALVATGVHK